jgi:hypothetical protein
MNEINKIIVFVFIFIFLLFFKFVLQSKKEHLSDLETTKLMDKYKPLFDLIKHYDKEYLLDLKIMIQDFFNNPTKKQLGRVQTMISVIKFPQLLESDLKKEKTIAKYMNEFYKEMYDHYFKKFPNEKIESHLK